MIAATFSGGYSVHHALAQQLGADRGLVQVFVVLKAVAPDHVHQPQGQRGVGAGSRLDEPVGAPGGRAAIRVNRHDGRAGLAGLDHQAPEVAVGVGGVRAPVDDELALGHGERIGPHAAATDGVFVTRRAGRGTDGPVQHRGPQPVEEPPVEAAGLELAHRPVVAVRQDRLRAIARAGDRGELAGDGVERLVPADRLEPPFPLAADPLHRLEQAIGAVDPLEKPSHLLAQEPSREAMVGIAPQLDRHAVLDRHAHAARVGAIERADVLDDGQ